MALTKIRDSGLPAGSVLQVVSSTKLDAFTSTSTSLVDITGTDENGSGSVWECNITLSSSSNKDLIMAHTSLVAGDAGAGLVLFRDSTQIYKGDASGSSKNRFSMTGIYGSSSANNTFGGGVSHVHYLDSPSSTSALTYKFQTMIRATTLYINQTIYDTDNDNASRTPSSLTLMEIAG